MLILLFVLKDSIVKCRLQDQHEFTTKRTIESKTPKNDGCHAKTNKENMLVWLRNGNIIYTLLPLLASIHSSVDREYKVNAKSKRTFGLQFQDQFETGPNNPIMESMIHLSRNNMNLLPLGRYLIFRYSPKTKGAD
jgi:hypothetical protein